MDYEFEIRDYSQAVAEAQTVADLRAAAEMLEDCGKSVLARLETMTDADLEEFHQGRQTDRNGEDPGQAWLEKYAEIILPSATIQLALICHEYQVPFGVAYNQWRKIQGLSVEGEVCD